MSSFGFLDGTSEKPKTDKASEDTLRPEKPQTPPESTSSIARPKHKGDAKQQEYIDYAWDISKSSDFIYMLKAENGLITPDRRSIAKGKNGHYDYGFCQINKGYHRDVVNDPKFFTDWKWQMDRCWEKFKGGTTFYGFIKFKKNAAFRNKILNSFTWES